MSTIKIYRKFYFFSTENTSNYNNLDPFSLSASTYVSSSGDSYSNTSIESSIDITKESTGVYFANLDAKKYASDITYDLVWYVQYLEDGNSNKKLTTRFRIKPYNISNNLDYETNTNSLDYEIISNF